MVKTLFFDLGNVLLFFDHKRMFDQVATLCGLDRKIVKDVLDRHDDPYERGAVNSLEIFDEMQRLSQKKIAFEPFMEAMGNIFMPNLPVIDLALQLKQKGHPLFLLSNTCDAHFKYALDHYPFLRHFDGYVLSFEAQARKPEPKIYEAALKMAGCQAEECFYTDDIPEYISSARALQIDAEQYTSKEALCEHLTQRGIL